MMGAREKLMGVLRIALAMAVLLGHLPIAQYQFVNAAFAVQGFYVVSGFYMALVLDGKYKDVGLFYSNRLVRLAPVYLVMMAVSAFTLWGLNASATSAPSIFAQVFANPLSAVIMGFENLFVIGQELLFWFTIGGDGALHFDASGALPSETTSVAWQGLLLPQAWSISMELMFYALAPWLARLSWRWLVVIALASMALRFAGQLLPVSYPLWCGRLFPPALFLFVFGMLAHRALPVANRLPKAIGWIAAALIVGVVVALPLSHISASIQRWIIYLAIAAAAPFMFNAFKANAIDRWIGDMSYPLYLSHLVVVGLVLTFIPNAPWALWAAIGGALAVSILLLILVDHPVDRWRQRRAQRAAQGAGEPTPAPDAATLALD
jgi:peptidoglycan/LPS O-acetylase OafA/YrhL